MDKKGVVKVSDGNIQQWFDDDTGEWIALTEDDIALLKARRKEQDVEKCNNMSWAKCEDCEFFVNITSVDTNNRLRLIDGYVQRMQMLRRARGGIA